ncbi:MAG: hypothetical protein K0Q59_1225 [Paenibacillus sp.]|jgi:hypothetical protein|nr:hypothetical protein [Paenibacillus sp.]
MQAFKKYMTINCYTFTCLLLLYHGLELLGWFPPMEKGQIYVYFLMTTTIALLIAWSRRLPVSNAPLEAALDIASIVIGVFGVGAAFRLFPFEWRYILLIGGMIAVIYVAVSGIMMIRDKAEARMINEKLLRRKERR